MFSRKSTFIKPHYSAKYEPKNQFYNMRITLSAHTISIIKVLCLQHEPIFLHVLNALKIELPMHLFNLQTKHNYSILLLLPPTNARWIDPLAWGECRITYVLLSNSQSSFPKCIKQALNNIEDSSKKAMLDLLSQ